jgi:hypothetical protein
MFDIRRSEGQFAITGYRAIPKIDASQKFPNNHLKNSFVSGLYAPSPFTLTVRRLKQERRAAKTDRTASGRWHGVKKYTGLV